MDRTEVVEPVEQGDSPDRSSRRIVITGAGGGAGATTLGLHLAQEIARKKAVCFVDLDVRWGAAARLGFDRARARTWGGVEGSVPEAVRLAALPVAGGFRVLLAPERWEQDLLPEVLDAVATQYDSVFVDVPRGRLLATALRGADVGVVVVPPTAPAARRATDLLAGFEVPRSAIVLNRNGPGGETTRAGIERILERRIALELPCCPRLRDAEDEPRLLSSSLSRWTSRVRRLAAQLER